MYPPDQENTDIKSTLQKGASVVVALPASPSIDATAAACAMYLAITKLGKSASIVCSNPPQSDLIASDKIQSSFSTSGDNLVISFPYADGSIDKVDYNIQNETFNLVVVPRPGFPKIDPQAVKYTYSGGSVDVIITIDSPNLASLGTVYTENQSQFQGKPIINIDRHLVNDFYGEVNIVNKNASSISELVFDAILDMSDGRDIVDRDISTNLYAGLMAATNNFTAYSVNASTFQIASELMKFGAVKKQIKKQATPGQIEEPSVNRGMAQPAPRRQNVNPTQRPTPMISNPMKRPAQRVQMSAQPPQIPQVINPGSPEIFDETPLNMVERAPEIDDDQDDDNNTGDTPQDWLKPKIFKGGGGLV